MLGLQIFIKRHDFGFRSDPEFTIAVIVAAVVVGGLFVGLLAWLVWRGIREFKYKEDIDSHNINLAEYGRSRSASLSAARTGNRTANRSAVNSTYGGPSRAATSIYGPLSRSAGHSPCPNNVPNPEPNTGRSADANSRQSYNMPGQPVGILRVDLPPQKASKTGDGVQRYASFQSTRSAPGQQQGHLRIHSRSLEAL
ncbi:hypothetical protein UCRNP2_1672 [Neofusicoccum parvum UCRNP2]|uniref:Uncharacterized protein n=1 Tax=Botryosphaeria parva (strain UCR-NP2) TaxID=1287680 RepID=R1GIP3_BOTPV|nr:hypothetical protein UCRNP2_1672 [Neofusicoccum parvum UCRNP2]